MNQILTINNCRCGDVPICLPNDLPAGGQKRHVNICRCLNYGKTCFRQVQGGSPEEAIEAWNLMNPKTEASVVETKEDKTCRVFDASFNEALEGMRGIYDKSDNAANKHNMRTTAESILSLVGEERREFVLLRLARLAAHAAWFVRLRDLETVIANPFPEREDYTPLSGKTGLETPVVPAPTLIRAVKEMLSAPYARDEIKATASPAGPAGFTVTKDPAGMVTGVSVISQGEGFIVATVETISNAEKQL